MQYGKLARSDGSRLGICDLMRDGSMPDPFWRDNERVAFELLKKDYEYHRVFTPDVLDSKRILLRCHGLDTLAHVSLNGKEIGYADNTHITWIWDVKPFLQKGTLSVSKIIKRVRKDALNKKDMQRYCFK